MAEPVKILAVSDKVMPQIYSTAAEEAYADVDFLIGCGDLPFYYLEFLVSALDVPLVYVRGNHDTIPQYTLEGGVLTRVHGGVDVHGRAVRVNDLLVAGLEGSMRYRPQAPLMYSEAEMRREAARLVPQLLLNRVRYGRFLDILVTHSPPYGIHDQPDRAHTGFRIFHWLVERFQPRYLLHGHIHVYRPDLETVTQLGETTVINVYPYRLIEYNDANGGAQSE